MPTYNMLDMFKFAFEHHVNVNLRQTQDAYDRSLDYIVSEYTNMTTSKAWRKLTAIRPLSPTHYRLVGLYSPDNAWDCEESVIPARVLDLLQPIMNAANNVTIISYFIHEFGEPITNAQKHGLMVFGRILEQVVQFVTCACDSAWDLGLMRPDFMPYDLYQFLDIYEKFQVWDRRVVEMGGARDYYNTFWHDTLGKSKSIYDNNHTNYENSWSSEPQCSTPDSCQSHE